jgi:hypothetical protein
VRHDYLEQATLHYGLVEVALVELRSLTMTVQLFPFFSILYKSSGALSISQCVFMVVVVVLGLS